MTLQQFSAAPSKTNSPKPQFHSPKIPRAPSSTSDSPKRSSAVNEPPAKTAQNTTPTTTQTRSNQLEQSDTNQKKTDPKITKNEKNEKTSVKEDKVDHKNLSYKGKDSVKDTVLKEQIPNKENVQKIESKDPKLPPKKNWSEGFVIVFRYVVLYTKCCSLLLCRYLWKLFYVVMDHLISIERTPSWIIWGYFFIIFIKWSACVDLSCFTRHIYKGPAKYCPIMIGLSVRLQMYKEMVKSILQYLGVIHSPNLHQLFILTR